MCLTGYTGTGSCDLSVRVENTFHCCMSPRIFFFDYRWLMQVCCRLSITLVFSFFVTDAHCSWFEDVVITKSENNDEVVLVGFHPNITNYSTEHRNEIKLNFEV